MELKLNKPVYRKHVQCHSNGRVHADEALGKAICLLHGTPLWWDEYVNDDGKVYVGAGGGIFDEHADGAIVPDNICAALLVARSLGVEDDPCWRPILETVCQRDRRAVDRCPRSIGKVINLANDFWPEQAVITANWAAIGFQTLYLLMVQSRIVGGETIADFFNSDVARNLRCRTHDLITRMGYNSQLVSQTMEFMIRDYDSLSIWEMAKAMTYFYSVMDAAEWLSYGVESLVLSRFLREEANEVARKLASQSETVWGNDGWSTRYVVARSDNRFISGALRHLKVPVTIQFNSRGNPVVFLDQKADLNLGFVAAELRSASLYKQGDVLVPPKGVLMSAGDRDGWYRYQNKTGGQFVAWETFTHPADEPCNLTPEEVEQAVVDGLRLALDDKQVRWAEQEEQEQEKGVKVS